MYERNVMRVGVKCKGSDLLAVCLSCTVLSSSLILSGCSGGSDRWKDARPPLVDASGVATFNGTPLEDAVVTFRPVEGNYAAFGRTEANGEFYLTTFDDGDGAVAGEYNVTVTKLDIELQENPDNPQVLPPIYHSEQSMIPATYGIVDESGLTATISSDGNDDLLIELVGSPEKKNVLADNR
ncbi:MAG: carboxypeptidase-like regulatory domain-containing protein [Rhodopirellula sp. JB044]|uniref:carboxypeptidase-like regulatory domain-containing protein n=1 Tax=Rhodopirellula sp. JB044 TaxID=3342844 RepID=UPI00370CF2EF